jgi:hypothetical protein
MLKSGLRSSTGIVALLASVSLALVGCEQQPGPSTVIPENAVARSDPAATPKETEKAPPAGPKPVLKPGAKTVVLEAAGDRPFDKTFDDLRFDIKIGEPFKREMLPEKIEAMKDQRIRIRGFILPTPQQRGIKTFVLVRDNQVCCFGPGAALYDCILVEMAEGKTAEYSIRPVTVDGTFDIQEVRGPDGTHLAIYHLAADSVQ